MSNYGQNRYSPCTQEARRPDMDLHCVGLRQSGGPLQEKKYKIINIKVGTKVSIYLEFKKKMLQQIT